MNLEKKKELAARTLNVSKERVVFNTQRLDEIKSAITKRDIKDLLAAKAIKIKEIKGRKRKSQRKTRRRAGSIRKKTIKKKRQYMILTRKLRRYLSYRKKKRLISKEDYQKIRKEIRASAFKNLSQLKEKY